MGDDFDSTPPPSSSPPPSSEPPPSSSSPSSALADAPICVNAVPGTNGSAPAVTVNTSARRTRHDWYWIALCNAFGSDLAAEIDGGSVWVVGESASFQANKDIIHQVYDYYGALNKQNPQKCIWAGLGRVAGGPFFGGFMRIDEIESQAKSYLDRCMSAPASFWESLGREDCESGPLLIEEKITYDECDASIKALMQMGRDIFDDLAWQHEAYLAGGLVEIQRLAGAGEFGATGRFNDATPCIDIWTMIDKDDAGAWSGNLKLFEREQLVTIPSGYRKLSGQFAVPTVMSYLAKSPHPWGRSFNDFWKQTTPFDSHYVTEDKPRWDWMRMEIYPTWQSAGDGNRNTLIARSLDELAKGHISVP
jgi:hypothetical protein